MQPSCFVPVLNYAFVYSYVDVRINSEDDWGISSKNLMNFCSVTQEITR